MSSFQDVSLLAPLHLMLPLPTYTQHIVYFFVTHISFALADSCVVNPINHVDIRPHSQRLLVEGWPEVL